MNVLGHRLLRDLRVPKPDEHLVSLRDELFSYPGVRAALKEHGGSVTTEVLLPLEFETTFGRSAWFQRSPRSGLRRM